MDLPDENFSRAKERYAASRLLFDSGKYRAAKTAIDEAIRLNENRRYPDEELYGEYRYQRAKICYELGEYEQADADFRTVIILLTEKNFKGTRYKLALAQAHFQNYEALARFLSETIASAMYDTIWKFFSEGGDRKFAKAALNEVISLLEKHDLTHGKLYLWSLYRFAEVCYSLEHYSQGNEYYRKALAIDCDADYDNYLLGVKYFLEKDYDAAIAYFHNAIRVDIGSAPDFRIVSPCEIACNNARPLSCTKNGRCPLAVDLNVCSVFVGYVGALKINDNLTIDGADLKKYSIDELIEYLTRLIEENSDAAELYNLRGQIYYDIQSTGTVCYGSAELEEDYEYADEVINFFRD